MRDLREIYPSTVDIGVADEKATTGASRASAL